MPVTVIYIATGMLLIGVLPLPYSYYTLLRIVATVVFLWPAFVSYSRKEKMLPWAFAATAILFNPLVKIHLTKELWVVVDIVAELFLLLSKSKIQEVPDESV